MDMEKQEVSEFLGRVLALDAEGSASPGCRIVVAAGPNLSRAKKAAAVLPIPSGPIDREKIVAQVMARLKLAKASGERRVWVQWWDTEVDDRHAVDSLEVAPDPGAAREGGGDDDGAGLSGAHATVVRGLLGELRHAYDSLGGMHQHQMELVVAAAAALREIEVRTELGWQGGAAEALKSIAPTLEKAVPESLRVYFAHQRLVEAKAHAGGQEAGPVVSSAGRARRACARLEAAVSEVATDLAALSAAGEITDALRMEVGGRLAALLSETQAALAAALQPPPAPQSPSGSSGASDATG